MALSDDQKAMLRLLAQREQGYDDIAALMGLSVDQVREKVKDALAELEQAPEPVEERAPSRSSRSPSPYRSRWSSRRHPCRRPPRKPASPKPARAPSKPSSAAKPKPKLPADKGAIRGLIAGGAVVLVLVLLLVTGVLGGDDDGSDSGSEPSGSSAQTTSSGKAVEPTQAVLEPVDGGDATGRALFGREQRNIVLLVSAKGLPPMPKGQSYTVSLSRSPTQRAPLVATTVNEKGELGGSFQVAPEVLGLIASGYDQIEISLIPNGELKAALTTPATRTSRPRYSGTDLLRGELTGPIVDAVREGG